MTEYFDGIDTKELGAAFARVRASMGTSITKAALADAMDVGSVALTMFEKHGIGLEIKEARLALPLLHCESFSDLVRKAGELQDLPVQVEHKAGRPTSKYAKEGTVRVLKRFQEAIDATPPGTSDQPEGHGRLQRIVTAATKGVRSSPGRADIREPDETQRSK